jgi:hypothetical protein
VAVSTNHSATSPNSSSGTGFQHGGQQLQAAGLAQPTRLTPAHSHNATRPQPAARTGVAVRDGKMAPMLPANATAMAAIAHHIEIQ